MNWCYITAGILLAIGFLVHMTAGNAAWTLLDPARRPSAADPVPAAALRRIWLMGRGGFQMIGADLLVASVYLLLAGTGAVPASPTAGALLAALFGLYFVGFLLGQLFSRAPAGAYLTNIQWILFLAVFILTVCGLYR